MRGVSRLIALAVVAVACLLGLAASAQAATIKPTVRFDEPDDENGNCTLREAIRAANENTKIDACRRGRGRDVIQLRRGTYTMSVPGSAGEPGSIEADNRFGDFDLFEGVVIKGHRRGTTIDGQNTDRLFQVFVRNVTFNRLTLLRGNARSHGGALSILTEGKATLKNVRIAETHADGNGGALYVGPTESASLRNVRIETSDGSVGGGIALDGTLRASKLRLTRNEAATFGGGIYAGPGARLNLDRSLLQRNRTGLLSGGGIYASPDARLVVKRTELRNNSASDGGGIYLYAARLNMRASTLAANKAAEHGGGLATAAVSETERPAVRIVNSTISRNVANTDGVGSGSGGGLAATADGPKRLLNSTVTGNRAFRGGGLLGPFLSEYQGWIVRGSIVSGNSSSAALGHDCASAPPVISNGFNLIGDLANCPLTPKGSDIVGKNPKLGPLKRNGGPTRTHALRKGSPAINKGPKNAPKRDQRGKKRKGRPDIGAYERR